MVEHLSEESLTVLSSKSPASDAGVKEGDVIIKADSITNFDHGALPEYLLSKKPGDSIKLVISRNKKEKTIKVTLIEQTEI